MSEKVALLTETQIVEAFRRALIAIYPVMLELDCISDDTQPYDPYDRVASALWGELVVNSLKWKYGLVNAPELPAYGFSGAATGADGVLRVWVADGSTLRFVGFRGSRAYGPDPFNAVTAEDSFGAVASISVTAIQGYFWEQSSVVSAPNPSFQRTATPPLN